ncbi:MAG: hypothetical protein ACOYL5_16560, partial [Phototrophicaceae bacterium]
MNDIPLTSQRAFIPRYFLSVCLSLVPFALMLIFCISNFENIPRAEHAFIINGLVLQLKARMLAPESVLRGNSAGHIELFSRLQSLAVASVTDWNLAWDQAISILVVVGSFLLILKLLRMTFPNLVVWLMPIIALLLFAIHQDVPWVSPYYSMWLYPLFFSVLAITLIQSRLSAWWSISLAALSVMAAIFSNTFALPSVFTIGLLVFIRYRKPYPLLAWLAISALIVFAFLAFSNIRVLNPIPNAVNNERLGQLSPANFTLLPLYYLGVLGNPFMNGPEQILASAILGILGLLLFAINVGYLVHRRQPITVWVCVASYSLGGIALQTLARSGGYPDGVLAAMLAYYRAGSLPFWVALSVLIGVTAQEAMQTPSRLAARLSFYINSISVIPLLVLLPIAEYRTIHHPYHAFMPHQQTEACYARFLFHQTPQRSSIEEGCVLPEYAINNINGLSLMHLTMFADWQPQNIIPDYCAGQPVIVEAHEGWVNLHFREWFIDGVDRVLYVAPNQPDVSEWPNIAPLMPFVASYDPEHTRQIWAFLGEAPPTVWHVHFADFPGLIQP